MDIDILYGKLYNYTNDTDSTKYNTQSRIGWIMSAERGEVSAYEKRKKMDPGSAAGSGTSR